MGRCVLPFALVFVFIAYHALPCRAQDDRTRARHSFEAGVKRYAAGDYQGALSAFEEAFTLQPHPTVRVNIANCYERLGRPVEAIRSFETYLNEVPEDAPASQRKEVKSALGRLRRMVGEIEFHVTPAGATIRIDDTEEVKAPPVAPVRVKTGRHSLEISQDGYERERREIDVAAGGRVTVAVQLRPSGPNTSIASGATGEAPPVADRELMWEKPPVGDSYGPEPTKVAKSSGLQLTTPVLVAGGATVALTLGAVVTGVLALKANSDFENAVTQSNNPGITGKEREQARNTGLSAASRADNLATVTDILIGGALIGAGLTTFLLLSQGSEEKERAANPGLSFAPALHPAGAGLTLKGSF